MDTSKQAPRELTINPVDFVIGGLTVSPASLSPLDWMTVVNSVLDIYRPYAKYFPFVAATGDTSFAHSVARATGAGVYFASEVPLKIDRHSINDAQRLFPVAPLYPWFVDRMPSRSEWDGDRLIEKHLLLSDKFEWVLFKRLLWKENNPGGGAVIGVLSHELSALSEDQVILEIGLRADRWDNILRSLNQLLLDVVSLKQERVNKLKAARSKVLEIQRRIT